LRRKIHKHNYLSLLIDVWSESGKIELHFKFPLKMIVAWVLMGFCLRVKLLHAEALYRGKVSLPGRKKRIITLPAAPGLQLNSCVDGFVTT
jgi:hypothetical protein